MDLFKLPNWIVRTFFYKQRSRECIMSFDDNGCKHCGYPCVYNKNRLLRPNKSKKS